MRLEVPEARSGAKLGRYELLLPVGHGGMAAVWIARLRGQAGFSKLVAIKTALPHLAGVAEVRRMLLDEARIAARVHHPNVVAIHELGDDADLPYVVMEWVDGLSLDRLIRGGPARLDPRLGARIIADACAGLHAAHELVDDSGQPLNVVHRDISPYNILVSLDGAVKIADFGIVQSRGQLHRTTARSAVRGRLSYMSPEQVNAEPLDRRADVFALGATLHETITGEMAFPGENDAQVVIKIAEAAYEPPPAPAGMLRDLFAIARRALARAPEDRFATAAEMRLALEQWLAKNAPPVMTSESVARLVDERVGPELARRRARLRRALNGEREADASLPDSVETSREATTAAADRIARTAGPGTETLGLSPMSTSVAVNLPRRAGRRLRVRLAPATVAAALVAAVGAGIVHVRVGSPGPSAPAPPASAAAMVPGASAREGRPPADGGATPAPTHFATAPAAPSAEPAGDDSGSKGGASRSEGPTLPRPSPPARPRRRIAADGPPDEVPANPY